MVAEYSNNINDERTEIFRSLSASLLPVFSAESLRFCICDPMTCVSRLSDMTFTAAALDSAVRAVSITNHLVSADML